MRENRTLRLTWRGLETEPWDGLRHRQVAKAAGKQRLPIPTVTAPVFDPTSTGGMRKRAKSNAPCPYPTGRAVRKGTMRPSTAPRSLSMCGIIGSGSIPLISRDLTISAYHVEELMQERGVSVDPATINWRLLGGHNVLEQRHLSGSFGLRDRSALRCLAGLVL